MEKLNLLLLSFFLLGFQFNVIAQQPESPINPNDPNIPAWAKLMYEEHPNVLAVDAAFRAFYKDREFKHTEYTRYYKRWRRFVTPYVEDDGSIVYPSLQERLNASWQTDNSRDGEDDWSFFGPEVHLNGKYDQADANVPISEQTNVYTFDRCVLFPDIMYSGTESGGVYKSVNHGDTWSYVTKGLAIEGVDAIGVDPFNPDVALFSSNDEIWRTSDGGLTWTVTGDAAFQALDINVWQFSFHPQDPQVVFAATRTGLYRSNDNGLNWTQVFSGESMSVEFKQGNPQIVYALRYNSTTKIAEFYKSTDGGTSFSARLTGWFTVPPADAGLLECRGGRIAQTEANPDRVYVLLVGTSQSNAALQLRGTIGVYSSSNAGETWTFPHVQMGMPYDQATHPNLMDFNGTSSTYNQIYYNTAFACSQLDEDRLLIGGLNLWRSEDGGASYQPVGGYISGLPLMHVDLQEFRVYKTGANSEEFWFSSDGGLNLSLDWCQTHTSKTYGISAVNFWGMDGGWNDDIIVGGRYHNGNGAYYDSYGVGNFLALGGGESATGYVNYSPERKTYFSDIGGRILPLSSDGLVRTFGVDQFPNESYYDNNSSRVVFDWQYWNIAYMGSENQLLISGNGGSSYSTLYTFGDASNRVLWIEQSHANPNVLVVQVLVNSLSVLYRSMDGGTTFQIMAQPQAKREIYFALSHLDENEMWLAYTGGSNGNKVYKSNNGGQSWSNITTTTLNGLSIKAIAHQAGTNGGIYIASRRGPVHYRNASLSDWVAVGSNVPAASYPLRLMPFYPKGKLRLGMWNIGVWEHSLYEPSALIADFSSDYKTFTCPGDSIWFVSHSVCDSTATYLWTFEGGSPSSSTDIAPKVTYNSAGLFQVTLVVTQNGISDTISKPAFIQNTLASSFPVSEDFELGYLRPGWKNIDDAGDFVTWNTTSSASGFGLGTHSMRFDNYYNNVIGTYDRFQTSPIQGLSSGSSMQLVFDVAYVRYGAGYSDSLAVYVSYDCGETRELIYFKGGEELAVDDDFGSGFWTPSASQWRKDTTEIFSITSPENDLVFVFENHNGYGQPIYVDNILISSEGVVTSIEDVQGPTVTCFPNPANNEIQIQSQGFGSEPITYRLVDATGRLIQMVQSADKQLSLSLSGLASGMYIIHVSTPNKSAISRFTKN